MVEVVEIEVGEAVIGRRAPVGGAADLRKFEAAHALPLRLYREGLIDGLRVDHVDGLADPPGYCRRLRAALEAADPSRTPWLVIEKILGADEDLPADWGVDGTTGYEVMNELSALQHDPAGADPLARLWCELSGRAADFEVEEHAARREVLTRDFAGQLDAAAVAFHRLAEADVTTRDLPLPALRRALVALIAAFSVYRTYAADTGQAPDLALARAKAAEPTSGAALDQIGRWLAGQGDAPSDLRLEAIRRFEQLSAPVAAKAVEDTAFYRYGRLLSRNDVGFDPAPGELKKQGHLFALIITPTGWSINEQNNKADPASKPIVRAKAATTFARGQWHTLLLEMKGETVIAHIEGRPPLKASARTELSGAGLNVARVTTFKSRSSAMVASIR